MQNYFFHLLYIYYNRNSEKSQIFNVQGGLIRALPTELSHKSRGSGTRTHDIGLTRTNKDLLKPPYVAGVAGFEPTSAGVKVLCLTNLAIPQYEEGNYKLLSFSFTIIIIA